MSYLSDLSNTTASNYSIQPSKPMDVHQHPDNNLPEPGLPTMDRGRDGYRTPASINDGTQDKPYPLGKRID